MNQCLFCRIAKKEITGWVIAEDDVTMAFLDIRPRASGHTLVIPKIHVQNILETTPETLGPLWVFVRSVTAQLQRTLHPDGFTIGINQGASAGQAIDHLHIHVIPRWHGDKGKSIPEVVESNASETVEALYKKITTI